MLKNLIVKTLFWFLFILSCITGKRSKTFLQQKVLRRAFSLSKGRVLEQALNVLRIRKPNLELLSKNNLGSVFFPSFTQSDLSSAYQELDDLGYYPFEDRISSELIDEFFHEMREKPLVGLETSDEQILGNLIPIGVKYSNLQKDLLETNLVKQLLADDVLNACLEAHLGPKSVLDMVAGWWSFTSDKPSNSAAQLYHYDLDRIKWLKVFIYLTDVDTESGPHKFLPGSHKTVGEMVSRDGRLSDNEVDQLYGLDNEITMTGLRGTVFIENTLGLHKGAHLTKGSRYILQIEKSVCHFGYPYPA
jgi:hypothetical protein